LGYKIILKLFSNFCCYSLQYFLSFTAQWLVYNLLSPSVKKKKLRGF
jgi:hypothetical protein